MTKKQRSLQELTPALCSRTESSFRRAGLVNMTQMFFLKILLIRAFPSPEKLTDMMVFVREFQKIPEPELCGEKYAALRAFDRFKAAVLELVETSMKRPEDFRRMPVEIVDWMIEKYSGEPAFFRIDLDTAGKILLTTAVYELTDIKEERDFLQGIEDLSLLLDNDLFSSLTFPISQEPADPPVFQREGSLPDDADKAYCKMLLMDYIKAACGLARFRENPEQKSSPEDSSLFH